MFGQSKDSIPFYCESEGLQDGQLVDAVGEHVATNKVAKPNAAVELFLNDNDISSDGIAKLADYAKNNRVTIKTLHIAGNKIDDKAVDSLVKMAKENGLRKLDLNDNKLTASGFLKLIDSPLSALSVAANDIIIDERVTTAIKRNMTLVDLSLLDNSIKDSTKESVEKLMDDIQKHVEDNASRLKNSPLDSSKAPSKKCDDDKKETNGSLPLGRKTIPSLRCG